MFEKIKKYQFLFEELVKRDFKKKYKRTVLGMLWSLLSPLLMLLVMSLVFTNLYGRRTPHFTIYLFAGNLVFTYFKDATNGGMSSLVANASIFTKVNVPKYLFLLSRNVSSLINFGVTLLIFFIFVAVDGLPFTWKFLLLVYPVGCLVVFNIGLGFILSALYLFYKDMQYLYDIFTLLLMYLSAIFYSVERFYYKELFNLNPIYVYITYIRTIVIDGTIPNLVIHLLCLLYAAVAIVLGSWWYKRYNYKFLYYL